MPNIYVLRGVHNELKTLRYCTLSNVLVNGTHRNKFVDNIIFCYNLLLHNRDCLQLRVHLYYKDYQECFFIGIFIKVICTITELLASILHTI